ncbi:hypothetical protein J1N35_035472 [Gossypium stocksii]|uniref:Uncharacterized protein n=1 Tax=Gossypium stocksii TaxID=47602 RepID=A0A9D3UU22_9ROSI|nr:hypothetical protein J1N35_035472 [Gossypium stocksii]
MEVDQLVHMRAQKVVVDHGGDEQEEDLVVHMQALTVDQDPLVHMKAVEVAALGAGDVIHAVALGVVHEVALRVSDGLGGLVDHEYGPASSCYHLINYLFLLCRLLF